MNNKPYFINNDFYLKYSKIKSLHIKSSKYTVPTKYSIIIPTYGRADLLKDAIYSCLRQTYDGPFEILVVDNNPTRGNETELVISEINDDRISYYKNTVNIGCLPNFNRCIELTASEYVIMLHTDDLLDSDYLNTIIPILDKHPEIDMLIPGKRIVKNEIISRQKGLGFLSRSLGLYKKVIQISERDFCHYNTAGGPLGIVMKKDLCMEIGGFNEDIFPMSDYAFWVRMAQLHNVFYLPKEFGTYRFYENISSEKGMQRNYIINEYHLIKALISDKPYRKMLSGYLYEYIRYRANVSELDKNDIFLELTGEHYKYKLYRKFQFIHAIIHFSFSFIIRAIKSRIRI